MKDYYHLQLMFYLEADIEQCAKDYKNLGPESAQLKKSIETQQHKLFIQWYNMNKERKACKQSYYSLKKIQKLGNYIINKSWKELIERGLENDN